MGRIVSVRGCPGDSWAATCADLLADALGEGLAETGRATLAGAGGSTPAPIYRQLARADLDWSAVTVTLVDERYVPETSDQSNAALIRRELMQGRAAAVDLVPLYHPQVTVDRAALIASRELATRSPRLDAVLLGMGEDGHICSMFPTSPTLPTLLMPGLAPAVLGVPSGRDGLAPPQERLTLNLPWLMTARRIVLALTGHRKRQVFEQQAAGDPRTQPIAALLAAGVNLNVLWTEQLP
ncbi:MAG: 6-phosphogluconolactonase [Brevundimonas sp.]|nr:MAG: 6-phosphogluconolactonase [Brevundimonas sp.]